MKRKARNLLEEIKATVRKHMGFRNLPDDASQLQTTTALAAASDQTSEVLLARQPDVEHSLWTNGEILRFS
jgi:hypothetical protein